MSDYGTLKANVSNELGLNQTAAGTEDVLVGRRLNEAVLQVLLETHCCVKSTTYSLTANTGDYDLQVLAADAGLNILAIDRLVDANSIPFERVSEDDIFDLRRASSVSSAFQRSYAVAGSNLLMIWPTPSAAETLTMYYVKRPTAMTTAGHDPADPTYGGIPAEHHPAIEFYALWRLASFDDDSSSGNGDRYFGQYQVWLAKMKKAQKLKAGSRQPRVRLGRIRRLASDPSRT